MSKDLAIVQYRTTYGCDISCRLHTGISQQLADLFAVRSNPTRPLDNKLLSALPRAQYNLLAPHLATISLPSRAVLFEPGDEVDHVYFPHSGMLSLLAVMRDGKGIETATVGREGVVGAMAGLRPYKSVVRVVVQMPMCGSKIASQRFRTVVASSEQLRNLCIEFNEALLTQARVIAACNALHSVEARFCRWLLQSADRANSNRVALTQDFLAEMLGVRRTSVNAVGKMLHDQRVINYSRGVIRIMDRHKLEQMSCECYQTLLDQPTMLQSVLSQV